MSVEVVEIELSGFAFFVDVRVFTSLFVGVGFGEYLFFLGFWFRFGFKFFFLVF